MVRLLLHQDACPPLELILDSFDIGALAKYGVAKPIAKFSVLVEYDNIIYIPRIFPDQY